MVVLLKITELATVETLLVSIPESLGLLAFGIGLVVAAVLLRSALGRREADTRDERVTKKA